MRRWIVAIGTLSLFMVTVSCIQSSQPPPSATKPNSNVSSGTSTSKASSPQPVTKQIEGGIVVLSDSAYTGSDGNLHIVGEVRNDTGGNIGQVKVTASLLDQYRKPYRVVSNLIYLSLLEPGQRSPFDVIFAGISGETMEYQLDLSWETTTKTNKTNLQIRQASGVYRDTVYWLTGEVYNAGAQKAENVIIVGAFYDNRGKVAAVTLGFPDVEPLGTGQSSPFSLAVVNPEKTITGSLIQAEVY